MQTDSGHRETNRRHALIMLLCCLVPVAAFVAIWVLGLPLNSVLLFAIVLLCPLIHLFLMRGGHQHQEVEGDPVEIFSRGGNGPGRDEGDG